MRTATFLAVLSAIAAVSSAHADTVTINRSGSIVSVVPKSDFFNPDGATSIDGYSVGEAFAFSATYNTADLVNPGTVTTAYGEPVSGPNFGAVGLGNGDPVNAVTETYGFGAGSHTFVLSDQLCFQSPSCSMAAGQEFLTGPTLLFDGNTFLGLDSCLFPGGGGFGTAVGSCSFVLDNLAPTEQNANLAAFGYTRSDMFFVINQSGDAVYLAEFDGPGVAGLSGAVPEPTTWAMMLAGLGLIGHALRRRRKAGANLHTDLGRVPFLA